MAETTPEVLCVCHQIRYQYLNVDIINFNLASKIVKICFNSATFSGMSN
jgi:hypothetical protein